MSATDRGFCLVELLVATVIFLIGAVGLLTLLTTTIAANTHSRNVTEATQLAQDQIELLRDQAWNTITAGSDTAGAYSRSWTVDTATTPGAAEVAVTVGWAERGGRQVRLQTVMR